MDSNQLSPSTPHGPGCAQGSGPSGTLHYPRAVLAECKPCSGVAEPHQWLRPSLKSLRPFRTLDLNIPWRPGLKKALGCSSVKDWGCWERQLAQLRSLNTFGVQNLRLKARMRGNVTWQLCPGSSVSHMMKNLICSSYASLNPEASMCTRLPVQTPCQKGQGLCLCFQPSESWFKLLAWLFTIHLYFCGINANIRAFNWYADLLK